MEKKSTTKKEQRRAKRLEKKEKRERIRQKYADEAFIVRFLHVNASVLSGVVAVFAAISVLSSG